MVTLTYRIDGGVVDTIDAIYCRMDSVANVLTWILANKTDANTINSDEFKKYDEEYCDIYFEYVNAIAIVTDMIPHKYRKYMINWEMTFVDRKMLIYFTENILKEYSWEEILCEMSSFGFGDE